jgi:alpha-galactosidase
MALLSTLALCAGLWSQPSTPPADLTAIASGQTVQVTDPVMGQCVIISVPGRPIAPIAPSANWSADFRTASGVLTLSARHEPNAVTITARWATALSKPLSLPVSVRWGPEPYPCRLAAHGEDDGLMQIQYGGEPTAISDALYDRFHDRALRLAPAGLSIVGDGPAYRMTAGLPAGPPGEAALLHVEVVPDFYRDRRGIKYFAPIDRSVFDRPQAGWCTWYYYYRGITEDETVANIRWLSANLRKFGLRWIQIDDGWQAQGTAKSDVWRDWRAFDPKFPHGMKWLGDQIKAAGFQAGVWLTPYATNAEDLVKDHPDWFVKDNPDHYFDAGWIGHYLLDPTNPPVRDTYLRGLFETMAREWGFDYFKIDGQPPTADMYRNLRPRLHEPMDGNDAYRLALATMRDVLGPKRFLLGCWGTPTEGIGYMNGSRTGGDVGPGWTGMMPAYDATKAWYFLHNVAWYCDPDCLCIREPMALEQAHVWASLYGLTGQHFMLSDKMYDLPSERVEIIKRLLPVADVRPADLYGRSRIDTIHLRLHKPGGPSSVVALFNWSARAARRTVDLAALGLPASGRERYLLYDFWGRACLGETTGAFKIGLGPRSCLVLAVRPWDHRPSLAGLDRHIAQAAVGLASLQVLDNGPSRTINGTSEIVADEPYRLAFALPAGWKLRSSKATGQGAKASVEPEAPPGLLFLTLQGPTSGEVRWTADFAGPSLPAPVASAPAAISGLRATPRRGDLHLTWDSFPGACYYVLSCNGDEIARTARTEAWDRAAAAAGSYRITAFDLLGKRLAESEEVRPVLPEAVTPPRPEVYLTDLKPVSVKQGWGELHTDQSVEGHPLTIGGRKFDRGLGTHAVSEIVYDLGGRSGKLVGWCGVDDEISGPGTIVFRVVLDGRVAWESDVLQRGDAPTGFVVPFAGARGLKLVVDDAGDGINYDHADWADAGLIWNK